MDRLKIARRDYKRAVFAEKFLKSDMGKEFLESFLNPEIQSRLNKIASSEPLSQEEYLRNHGALTALRKVASDLSILGNNRAEYKEQVSRIEEEYERQR